MTISFPEALVVVGLLLMGGALLSGVVHRTVLSLTLVATGAGAVAEWTGVLAVHPGAHAIVVVVELVLLVTLFADGLLVEREVLREHSRPALRALALAMPINALLLAGMAKLLFGDLSWAEALLLGFVLSPTDPVVTSSIVASRRVPQRVRHTLNLESGLNDGLALPFVLLLLAISVESDSSVLSIGGSLALETVIGLAVGVVLGMVVGVLIGRLPEEAVHPRYEGLILLGAAAGSYGAAELAHGNGLIAAFVAGVGLALLRDEAPDVFHERNENITNVLHLVAFAIFGALVFEVGYNAELAPLAAFVVFALLVARPASVLVAFVGVRMAPAERAFVAWFGPKGIASMLFALFVLDSIAPDRTLLFEIAAFTVLASIAAHGLTDTLGSERIAERMDADDKRASGDRSVAAGAVMASTRRER